MYISRIEIKNIRCFEELSINFEEDGVPILWSMITGDNAVGKTLLLRCIAMGLCDESSAAALMKELKGQFIRFDAPEIDGEVKGSIKIYLKNEGLDEDFFIITEIKQKPPGSPEKVTQLINGNLSWDDILIFGYGPLRGSSAVMSHDDYLPIEAVYTLFNYEASLQNPELVLRRQDIELRDQLGKKLLSIMMLDEYADNISFTKRGMEIAGPWGTLPVEVLSDGYRSTIYWITDFFGWNIYADTLIKGDKEEFGGILLIDELEQHLHPSWQRYVVQELRSEFPRVQFITTTHSPLIAAGTSDIDNAIMCKLKFDDYGKIKEEIILPETLRGMRADQVLTSVIFDLVASRMPGSLNDITRYTELYSKKARDSKEEEQFQKLSEMLEKVFTLGDTKFDRIVEKALQETLDRLSIQETGVSERVLFSVMRRHLGELLNRTETNDKDQI